MFLNRNSRDKSRDRQDGRVPVDRFHKPWGVKGNKMKKFAVTLLTGIAFAGIASPAAAAAPTGARVEALVGSYHAQVDFTDLGAPIELEDGGIVFGVGAGYDFGGGDVSFGLDVEATLSTAELDVIDGTDSAELDIRRDLYAGGRVSFAVSPTANVYVKAGYTNARIRGEVTTGGTTDSDSANADGVRGGIGAQFSIGGNAYVGGEYRYSNYEADFSRHQAVLTLGTRF
jgi:outer membrane immunogenic protein